MDESAERGYTREESKESIGKGWHKAIDILLDAKPSGTTVVQVKEKFGGLRFYTVNPTEDYRKLIGHIENLCDYLCEFCGKLGDKDEHQGWVKNVCPECKEERRK